MRKYLMVAMFGLLAQSARADVYSVAQSGQTCQSGKCGGVMQKVASNAVGYASSVGNAVIAPARAWRPFQRIAEKIEERRSARKSGCCR